MFTGIDRVQIVTPDRSGVAAAWERSVGASVDREDAVSVLGAARTVLRVGVSEVELLEPDGDGPVSGFMAETGGRGGIFAVGFATTELDAVRSHFSARSVECSEEGDQLFVGTDAVSGGGFRAVISPDVERERAGVMTRLRQVTYLVADREQSATSLAETFAFDPDDFGTTESPEFGFAAVNVHVTAERRHDVETATPTDDDKAMGRFLLRRGPSFYMCFGESDDLPGLRDLLMQHSPEDWTGPRDGELSTIFVHPKALGGVMLGVAAAG